MSVETMSLYRSNIYSKGKYMKTVMSILSAIYSFLCACGQAKYAAELSRNGKWAQAQALYKK